MRGVATDVGVGVMSAKHTSLGGLGACPLRKF